MLLTAVLASYMGCAVDHDRLSRPPEATAPVLEDAPPSAAGPEQEALYQVLFAGEHGETGRRWGQRARALAWFTSMDLTEDQLRGLASLRDALAVRESTLRDAEEAAATAEAEALEPVYAELLPLLAQGADADPEALADAGTRLSAARDRSGRGTLSRIRHEQLRGMLEDTRAWIDTLSADQQLVLGSSRFLLRHQVGPLVSPGDHGELLGTVWDGASFDSLVLGRLPEGEEPLDIGGLWASEDVRNTPDKQLGGVQKQVLVLLAARSPGLEEAIEVALGTRAPDAFGDAVISSDETEAPPADTAEDDTLTEGTPEERPPPSEP